MKEQLAALGISQVNGILMDIGVSSPQIDEAGRGFSFRMDGPLDMRMDTTCGLTAAQWLAQASESDIARVLRDYGEGVLPEKLRVPSAACVKKHPLSARLSWPI